MNPLVEKLNKLKTKARDQEANKLAAEKRKDSIIEELKELKIKPEELDEKIKELKSKKKKLGTKFEKLLEEAEDAIKRNSESD